MYLEHFGLNQAPFRITPHTEFFFAGAKRGATLEALIYAITHDEGIVKVCGEVGSGKTMLCRMLLERLPENVETVYLANPLLSRHEIPFAIADELRIRLPDERNHSLLRSLQERLLETYAAGRQVVVLIDEAHAMPLDALEEVRLLSNLESNRHKLLQIVLFGQPELDVRLHEAALRQLNDRITHSFRLEPLHHNDIAAYLMFRLRAAGYRGPDLFTPAAIKLISKASEGLTRRINILADKALLAAYSEGTHRIDRLHVKAAIRDSPFTRLASHRPKRWLWATAGVLALGLVAGLAYRAGSRSSEQRAVAATESVPPALAAATPMATAPSVSNRESTRPQPEGVATVSSLAPRIAATEEWLKRTPDRHYFIQLLTADGGSQRKIVEFINSHAAVLDVQQVRVYRSSVGGRSRLGVIYGDYATRNEAEAALAALGEVSPASRPYLRTVGRLRSPVPQATATTSER